MQSINPSHILIARNARSPNQRGGQSGGISSPEVDPAAASGVFRSTTSGGWHHFDSTSPASSNSSDQTTTEIEFANSDDMDAEEAIVIDETFTKRAKWPGTVKIIVEKTTFWTHKDILVFASPFFEAALSGNWSETGRPLSMSSVITISQPPSVPDGDKTILEPSEGVVFAPPPDSDSDGESDDNEHDTDNDTAVDAMGSTPNLNTSEDECSGNEEDNEEREVEEEEKKRARVGSLEKLQGKAKCSETASTSTKGARSLKPVSLRPKRASRIPEAIIVLKEEKASTFLDFLKFVYPHLECTITWNNVEGLMNISHKLVVPSLQRSCLDFLLTHAAGKPIKAMRIAELFEEDELYRESSRFVLDNPGGWSDAEIGTLSQDTLLKLEKRRNWFLERVLKLGLTNIAKEYQCCPTCPDPLACARLLEEKWKQAYHAVFRFGPCQPSMVYRYLRTLEGISPPLQLTHLACQNSAKSFTATLFDRMFSLGVRGSGTDTQPPLGVRVAGAATGPRRHFLFCSLKPEQPITRPRRSRDLL
ncbi:hypothetical protein M422DRAFT_32725 [Sphaerobolus stellatus SS14]|uniref:Unplaced genomic scaffold SPHSTscaffold_77, whole genome shotgun sequence n=1 Tax=Sphaerobolus stellatus (strain SS14) TaxID=990650 RepID=A0A0C9VDL2_SPHS4|nr:hypothetical protein M422DRAFT_32725 [Sphaerobolus stellatus SS14]